MYKRSPNKDIRNDKNDMLPPSDFLANTSWQRSDKKETSIVINLCGPA